MRICYVIADLDGLWVCCDDPDGEMVLLEGPLLAREVQAAKQEWNISRTPSFKSWGKVER